MRINHVPLVLGLLLIIVGASCFGVGILSGMHLLTFLGMLLLPAGIFYGLLAGYPSHEAPPA